MRAERFPEETARDETGLSGPGEDLAEDIGRTRHDARGFWRRNAPGRRRDRTVFVFHNKPANDNVTKGRHAERRCRPCGRENL